MGDNEFSKLKVLSFDQGLRLVFITRLLFQSSLLILSILFILVGSYIFLISSRYNELMFISMFLFFLTIIGVIVSLDIRCVFYSRSLGNILDGNPEEEGCPGIKSVQFMDRLPVFLFFLGTVCFLIGLDLALPINGGKSHG